MSATSTLITGLAIGESPRWHDGRLFISDMGANELRATTGDMTSTQLIATVPGMPMGTGWLPDPDGRMLIVSSRDAKLLRREPDGTLVTHADLAPLSKYPWSDMVVDGRGNAYTGSIGFDFPFGEVRPGILALITPDGTATQQADGIEFSNGVAVTPDNRTLILAESYGRRLTAFGIADDGTLSGRRVWADLGDGVPDGICIDAEGAVWYADVPNKRCVRVREGGEVLEVIDVDRGCYACALGGADGRTLYIVAAEYNGPASMGPDAPRTGQLLAAPAPAPGAGWP
jgi:sugar lactone lactonase YvrE